MNRRPPWSPHGSLSPRKRAYLSPRLGQHQRGSHKSTYRRCSPLMTIRYSATPLLAELYHLLSFDPDPRRRGPVLCTPVTTAASRSTGAAHQPAHRLSCRQSGRTLQESDGSRHVVVDGLESAATEVGLVPEAGSSCIPEVLIPPHPMRLRAGPPVPAGQSPASIAACRAGPAGSMKTSWA